MSVLKFWKSILLAVLILILCLIPSQELKKIDFLKVDFQDLFVHLVMFLSFSFFLATDLANCNCVKTHKRIHIALVIFVSFLFATLTELLQMAFPALNRSASLGDLLFDLIGIVLGIIVADFIKR